jgi:hypothetical protein
MMIRGSDLVSSCASFCCDWLERAFSYLHLGLTYVEHSTERVYSRRDCESHVCGCAEIHGPHCISEHDLVSPTADCFSTVLLMANSWYVNKRAHNPYLKLKILFLLTHCSLTVFRMWLATVQTALNMSEVFWIISLNCILKRDFIHKFSSSTISKHYVFFMLYVL